jgi:hypothetical protein
LTAHKQQLSSRHDYLHCLDHSLHSLLATGYFGFGNISCFMDNYTPFQVTWYCSRWTFWITERYHHAPWQNATALAPGADK